MRTIWKFPLAVLAAQEILLPDEAQVLAVQMQGGQPCLWAIVESEAPLHGRQVRICGTGHPVDDGCDKKQYVGTLQMADGALVFHVFIYG